MDSQFAELVMNQLWGDFISFLRTQTIEPEPIKPVEVKLYSLDDIKELLKASK